MKTRLKDVYIIGAAVALCLSMAGCSGDRKAEKEAKAFLRAYYTDLDFVAAQTHATAESASYIDERREMTALNPYAKSEAPAIVFKSLKMGQDNTTAEAFYTHNRAERTLYLQKVDGKWKVDLQKEAALRNEGMHQLADGVGGGFASAVSGPVVYKKRNRTK